MNTMHEINKQRIREKLKATDQGIDAMIESNV